MTPEQAQFLLDMLITHFPELEDEDEEMDGAITVDALRALYDQVSVVVVANKARRILSESEPD